MKRTVFVFGLCMLFALPYVPCWGAEAYVSDSFKITLRTEPNGESKIIAMLSSGEPIEILDANDSWSYVRYEASEGTSKEGWVLTRFIMDREPWESRVEELQRENTSLQREFTELKKKWEKSSGQEQELITNLQTAEEKLKKLAVENERLRASQKVRWFIVGALVMLIGWLLGLMTGRLQRKRRQTFYSYGS